MTWLIPRDELTSDQLQAIESDVKAHRVILGAAGSGKTQVLLHRAHHLRESLATPPERFHIFVYTNVLRHYIQSALSLLQLPGECVSTFDAWCVDYFKSNIGGKTPWNKERHQPDFVEVRNGVLNCVRDGLGRLPVFDFVLVDEGQDLDEVTLEILTRIAKHVTVCVDQRQQIYDQGSSKEAVLRHLGIGARNITFLETFRCSPYIVQVAAKFIDNAEEYWQFIQRSRTAQIERETPLLYQASNQEDEVQRLCEVVRTRQSKGDKIAVLFPENRKVYGFAKALQDAGLEVETPRRDRATGTFAELDFNSDLPKVLTYYAAKGLTFDSVIMPRLVRGSFRGMDKARILKLLFVGITRATKWVYLSTIGGDGFEPLDNLMSLQQAGCLSVQKGGEVGPNPQPRSHTDDLEDILDIL